MTLKSAGLSVNNICLARGCVEFELPFMFHRVFCVIYDGKTLRWNCLAACHNSFDITDS